MDIVVHQRKNDPFKEHFNKWTKTTWSTIFRGGKIKINIGVQKEKFLSVRVLKERFIRVVALEFVELKFKYKYIIYKR